MKLIVKILSEREELTLEDKTESCSILEVKKSVEETRGIPTANQRILFKGRPLSDSKTLKDYGIQHNDKLHLSVKKNKDIDVQSKSPKVQKQLDFWKSFDELLDRHFTAEDAKKVLQIFRTNYENLIESVSLDDLERIAIHELTKH